MDNNTAENNGGSIIYRLRKRSQSSSDRHSHIGGTWRERKQISAREAQIEHVPVPANFILQLHPLPPTPSRRLHPLCQRRLANTTFLATGSFRTETIRKKNVYKKKYYKNFFFINFKIVFEIQFVD